MSGFAIEQIQEQMRQLKLVRTAEQLQHIQQTMYEWLQAEGVDTRATGGH